MQMCPTLQKSDIVVVSGQKNTESVRIDGKVLESASIALGCEKVQMCPTFQIDELTGKCWKVCLWC